MKNQSFDRRFRFAFQGIKGALRSEASLRFQLIAAAAVIAFAVYVKPSPIWWAILFLATGAVITAEMLNTALEHVVDRLHPEQHPTIKLAKDCAAGAVLITSIVSVAVFATFVADCWSQRG